MATEAGCRRVFEGLVCVAVTARRFVVLSNQRKIGGVVVKFHVFPARWRMAVATGIRHRIFVNVVVAVAVDTV